MYCEKCGTHNPLGSKYCRECGNKLEVVKAASLPEEVFIDRTEEEVKQASELVDLAFKDFSEGKIAEAVEQCKKALELNPSSTSAHSLLGLLYEKQGKLEEGVKEYKIVVGLNPDSDADRQRLDNLLKQLGRVEKVGEPSPKYALDKIVLAIISGVFVILMIIFSWSYVSTKKAQQVAKARILKPSPQARMTYPPSVPPQPETVKEPKDWERYFSTPFFKAPPSAAPQRAPVQPTRPQYIPPPAPTPPKPIEIIPVPPKPETKPVTKPVVPPVVTPEPVKPQIVVSPKPVTMDKMEQASQHERMGSQYHHLGDYENAITEYRQVLKIMLDYPDAGRIHQNMANCYHQLKKYKEALVEYILAIDAYKAQIAANRYVEEAKLGIKTCEAGIRVCELEIK